MLLQLTGVYRCFKLSTIKLCDIKLISRNLVHHFLQNHCQMLRVEVPKDKLVQTLTKNSSKKIYVNWNQNVVLILYGIWNECFYVHFNFYWDHHWCNPDRNPTLLHTEVNHPFRSLGPPAKFISSTARVKTHILRTSLITVIVVSSENKQMWAS